MSLAGVQPPQVTVVILVKVLIFVVGESGIFLLENLLENALDLVAVGIV